MKISDDKIPRYFIYVCRRKHKFKPSTFFLSLKGLHFRKLDDYTFIFTLQNFQVLESVHFHCDDNCRTIWQITEMKFLRGKNKIHCLDIFVLRNLFFFFSFNLNFFS